MSQFGSQASFLLVITVLSLAFKLGDVVASQMSQAIDALWSGLCFFYSWKYMEAVPARNVLPEGKSLLTQGFVQTARTVREINRTFKKGTRWFFLALTFAAAGANAFTVVAVVFLGEELGLSFIEIGIFFFVSLVFSIPGSFLGAYVTSKLDPKRSWRLVMILMMFWTSIGAVVLDFLPQNLSFLSYLWGAGIGVFLGWYYPTQNLFFSMCLPKGQEAELAGFFVYCSQILGWLPPLTFSIMVEANVGQTYGVIAVSMFLLLAAGIVSLAAPWPEILEEAGRSPNKLETERVDDDDSPKNEERDAQQEAQLLEPKPSDL
jgi:MFS-type transporter involved in bile tolerance (Atg22 family)